MVPIIFSLLLISAVDSLPRCREVGTFPLEDPRAYLECSLTPSNDLLTTVWSCGELYYSPSKKICTPHIELENEPLERRRARRNGEIASLSPSIFLETSVQTECGTTNRTGIFCYNQTHVAVCIATYSEMGTYASRELAYPCVGDSVCFAGEGCKKDYSLLSRARPFACSDDGRFPDPYNCTIYHDCTASTTDPLVFTEITTACTGNEIYSIRLKACTNITEKETCFPGIYCHSDLEIGMLIDDTRIYYVCHTAGGYPSDLSPSLYSCGNQQVFHPVVLACVSTHSNVTWNALSSPTVF